MNSIYLTHQQAKQSNFSKGSLLGGKNLNQAAKAYPDNESVGKMKSGIKEELNAGKYTRKVSRVGQAKNPISKQKPMTGFSTFEKPIVSFKYGNYYSGNFNLGLGKLFKKSGEVIEEVIRAVR